MFKKMRRVGVQNRWIIFFTRFCSCFLKEGDLAKYRTVSPSGFLPDAGGCNPEVFEAGDLKSPIPVTFGLPAWIGQANPNERSGVVFG